MQSSKCKSKQSNAQANANISNASKLMHKQMQSISKCKQAIRYKHKQANASKQANRQKQANDESKYVYEMQARKYKPVSKTAS
jgi:hypothetical protein